jgi:hypothetical protein
MPGVALLPLLRSNPGLLLAVQRGRRHLGPGAEECAGGAAAAAAGGAAAGGASGSGATQQQQQQQQESFWGHGGF